MNFASCRPLYTTLVVGGTVTSWSVCSTPEGAVQVRALAGDLVLCSWARQATLTMPLSTQVYKWVPANYWGNLTKLRGSDLRWNSILTRGGRNTSTFLFVQKKIWTGTSHYEISISCTTYEHLIQFLLYYLSSGRLRGVKYKRKYQTLSSKSGCGR